MSEDKKDLKTDKIDQAIDNGTASLLAGAGVGTYGATMFVASGFVCPACVFVAPALLGVGAYQRHKHKKSKADGASDLDDQ